MTNPNDPAFPHEGAQIAIRNNYELSAEHKGNLVSLQAFYQGLTKRELFAAMAMQGMSANSDLQQDTPNIVSWAVELADALIAELNKEVTK